MESPRATELDTVPLGILGGLYVAISETFRRAKMRPHG